MKYIHVKSLEKYHPGYKDRTLQWAKIYFKMAQGDPAMELLHEIDWGRYIRFVLLELEAQSPIPLDEAYLVKKGFDLKIRPMSFTLQMLHNSVEVVTENHETCNESVTQNKSRVDKEKNKKVVLTDSQFLESLETNPAYKGIDIQTELSKMDAWLLTHPGRQKTRRFVVGWLNRKDKVMDNGQYQFQCSRSQKQFHQLQRKSVRNQNFWHKPSTYPKTPFRTDSQDKRLGHLKVAG